MICFSQVRLSERKNRCNLNQLGWRRTSLFPGYNNSKPILVGWVPNYIIYYNGLPQFLKNMIIQLIQLSEYINRIAMFALKSLFPLVKSGLGPRSPICRTYQMQFSVPNLGNPTAFYPLGGCCNKNGGLMMVYRCFNGVWALVLMVFEWWFNGVLTGCGTLYNLIL
jgi:hypothetical protein